MPVLDEDLALTERRDPQFPRVERNYTLAHQAWLVIVPSPDSQQLAHTVGGPGVFVAEHKHDRVALTQGDPRIDAIVPISGNAYLHDRAGLSSITVPMMAIGGTGDFVVPWDWGPQLAYEGVSSARKSLVAFVDAGHQIPTDSCENMPFASQLPDMHREVICTDPAWDKADARRWIRHFSTAFLLDVLTGDVEAKAALASGAEVPPELVYTTTL